MRHFLLPVLVVILCRTTAAEEPDAQFEADLASAQALATLLEKIGEPNPDPAEFISIPDGRYGLVRIPVDLKPTSQGYPCLLVSAERGREQLLFDDGIVRDLHARIPPKEDAGKPGRFAPWSGILRIPLRDVTAWELDGKRFLNFARGKRGAWRMAHWAAWHARLGEKELAVAAVRASLFLFDEASPEFKDAPALERIAWSGVSALAGESKKDGRGDEELLEFLERVLRLADFVKDPRLKEAVNPVRMKLKSRQDECAARVKEIQDFEARWRAWMGVWAEADITSIAKLPREDQAEYWVRQLPSWHDPEAEELPGIFFDNLDRRPKGAVRGLLELDLDAVPALVDGCLQTWSTQSSLNWERIQVGDVCSLLLQKILGSGPLPSTHGSIWPGRDLAQKERRERVEAWWSRLKPLPWKERWVVLWKDGSTRAAQELVRLDARTYLPEILEETFKSPGRPGELHRLRLAEHLAHCGDIDLPALRAELPDACHDLIDAAIAKRGSPKAR